MGQGLWRVWCYTAYVCMFYCHLLELLRCIYSFALNLLGVPYQVIPVFLLFSLLIAGVPPIRRSLQVIFPLPLVLMLFVNLVCGLVSVQWRLLLLAISVSVVFPTLVSQFFVRNADIRKSVVDAFPVSLILLQVIRIPYFSLLPIFVFAEFDTIISVTFIIAFVIECANKFGTRLLIGSFPSVFEVLKKRYGISIFNWNLMMDRTRANIENVTTSAPKETTETLKSPLDMDTISYSSNERTPLKTVRIGVDDSLNPQIKRQEVILSLKTDRDPSNTSSRWILRKINSAASIPAATVLYGAWEFCVEWVGKESVSIRLGVGEGAFLFLALRFFSSPSAIFRFVGVSPSALNNIPRFLLICVQIAGLLMSEQPFVQSPGVLAAVPGMLLVLSGWGVIGLLGGYILAFVLFAIFPSFLLLVTYSPTTLVTMFFLMLTLLSSFITSVIVVAYEFVPFGWILRPYGALTFHTTLLIICLIGWPWRYWRPLFRISTYRSFYRTAKRPSLSIQVSAAVLFVLALLATSFVGIRSLGISEFECDFAIKNGTLELKVMSYNIHQSFTVDGLWNLEAIKDIIYDERPCLIGLQETDMNHLFMLEADIEYISGLTGLHESYGSPTADATFGVATLSSFIPSESKSSVLYYTGERPDMCSDTYYIKGVPVTFMNVHFGLIEDDKNMQAYQVLDDFIGSHDFDKNGPIIFVGDFNSKPTSEEYAILTGGGLRDVIHEETGGYPVTSDVGCIDYIFIMGQNVTHSQAQIRYSDGEVSDHFPLLATIDIPIP